MRFSLILQRLFARLIHVLHVRFYFDRLSCFIYCLDSILVMWLECRFLDTEFARGYRGCATEGTRFEPRQHYVVSLSKAL